MMDWIRLNHARAEMIVMLLSGKYPKKEEEECVKR